MMSFPLRGVAGESEELFNTRKKFILLMPSEKAKMISRQIFIRNLNKFARLVRRSGEAGLLARFFGKKLLLFVRDILIDLRQPQQSARSLETKSFLINTF